MAQAEAPAYRALALQARCRSVNAARDRAEARAWMKESIDRLRGQIASSVRFIGPDCRLVVLPEYVLTGHPVGEPIEVWADRAAIEPGGPEEEGLAGIARDLGVFLAANAYESDPNFPDLYFQACLIFDPSGATILRYRRMHSLLTPTPWDVWDRYLDVYGIDGVFPVARTEIGNLACIASDEILFPELARCFAVRGAEVLCHPTSEAASPNITQKDIAKRARALENMAYLVSANTGGIEGSPIPGDSTDGKSQVVDFLGRVLVDAAPGESMAAFAEIDLGALRRERRRPGMGNLLSRARPAAFAEALGATRLADPNSLGDGRAPGRGELLENQRAVVARLIDEGVIQP
ncbi:MAG: nitrilase [Actinobacteria bacterium]|nr:MAG: nitrilase [Actinomycetota bacterium]